MESQNIKKLSLKDSINNSNDNNFQQVEVKDINNIPSKFKRNLVLYKKRIIIVFIHILIFLFLILFFIIYQNIQETKLLKEEFPQTIYSHFGDKPKESKKYLDLCLNGILIDKNISTYKLSDNPKVSIVIAFYNKESYILRALRSIQNQPLKDIEIIFVDDCSTDNSLQIMKNLQKEDNRIRIIHNDKNIGVLRVREKGVRNAKGKYVFIMDGDDLLLEHGINDGYQIAELKNLDIVEFNNYNGKSNLQLGKLGHIHKPRILYKNEIQTGIFKRAKDNKIRNFCYSLWRYLIKREVLIQAFDYLNLIYLNRTGINYYDDTAIQYVSIHFAKSFQFINVPGYYWLLDPKSLTHNIDVIRANQKVLCFSLYIKLIWNLLDDSDEGYKIKGLAARGALIFVSNQLEFFTEGFDEVIQSLDLYIKNPKIPKNYRAFMESKKKFILKRYHQLNKKDNIS